MAKPNGITRPDCVDRLFIALQISRRPSATVREKLVPVLRSGVWKGCFNAGRVTGSPSLIPSKVHTCTQSPWP